jgi:predicted nucleotidyltransferase
MVSNKQQIIKLVIKNKQAFRDLGAKSVGLFGSFARDGQTNKSDVDLLVDFLPGRKSYRNLLGLADLAEKLVGREVEVLTLQSVTPSLASYIKRDVEYVQTA